MKLIDQSWKFTRRVNGNDMLKQIERAGRTCYRSENKITPDSARAFVSMIMDSGHLSVIEHCSIGVRIVTDRGVTHELVRHRLAAYSQESTRYCNYAKDTAIRFILPVDFALSGNDVRLLREIEKHYVYSIAIGRTAQQARYFLPNGVKTEIVTTANLREWRHIFTMRTSPRAHPQMRALMTSMLAGFQKAVPVIFDAL